MSWPRFPCRACYECLLVSDSHSRQFGDFARTWTSTVPFFVVVLQHVAGEVVLAVYDTLRNSLARFVRCKIKFILSGLGKLLVDKTSIYHLVEWPGKTVEVALQVTVFQRAEDVGYPWLIVF